MIEGGRTVVQAKTHQSMRGAESHVRVLVWRESREPKSCADLARIAANKVPVCIMSIP